MKELVDLIDEWVARSEMGQEAWSRHYASNHSDVVPALAFDHLMHRSLKALKRPCLGTCPFHGKEQNESKD